MVRQPHPVTGGMVVLTAAHFPVAAGTGNKGSSQHASGVVTAVNYI